MNFIDEQILQLKKKHSDPNYVAPNLQNVVPQDDNEQGLGTWLGAAGIGAGRMLNNTITGGIAQILGSIGAGVEHISPWSGSQADERRNLTALGVPLEVAKQLYPDQDSWLTSGTKGLLEAQNYIDDNLTELRNEVVGDNTSYGTQVAEGTGSSLGFMGAGYGASALASLAGLGPVGVVLAGLIAAGATEALSESGGTLGDAYRQGKYDDGGLAAANKSFAANALLNAGLNYVGGHFSPLTRNIRNPFTKFAVNTLGQIGNELLQEPSQQTIEKATQDSLNNGGNFLTALTQRAGDWGNDFVQLAPSVAGSSLLTSLLTGGAAMANPKIRSNVMAEYRNRNVDRESTIAQLQREISNRQTLQSKLQAETKTPWYNQALVDDINKKIQRADSEIERLQGLLQPQPLQYATQPNETQQNPTIMDLGTNEAFLDDLDYSDFGNDNSNPEQDIPESYAQYISGQNQPYSSPLSFHEFKNAQANQDFDYQSVLRAIAQTSKNNLVPEVEHITPNIAPANTVQILPDITAPNTEHIRPDNSRPAVIRDAIDLQALLPTQNNNLTQQTTKSPRIMALGSNEAYYDDDYYSDYFPVNRDAQISPQEQDIPEGHVPNERQTQNQEQQQGKSENNQQTVPQNKISDNEDFSQFKLDNLTSHNHDVDNSPMGSNAIVKAGNKHYAVRYRVIDVRKLITSHKLNGGKNPHYDQSLQNRQRENIASRIAVDNMAQDIDPSLLTANPFASDGAPIIGSDGQVESGNGRTLALLKAYMSHNPDGSSMAEHYRRYLIKHAHEFGLNPQDVDAIERPILVRERWSQADRKAFTREANKSSQATFSKTERALDDVDKLTPEILITFNPDKDIESQQDFIRAYASAIVDKSELPDFIQANSYSGDVKISKSGLERIQNTLFAKAYGDTDILQRINEVLSSEDPVKNFSNAIIKAAPKIAIFQAQLEAANNRTDNQDTIRANNSLSLRDDIKRAFEILTEAKLNHTNVEAVVSQGNIVSYTSKEAEAIAKFCERYIRSAKRITTAFNYYADEAAARLDTGQLTFNNQKQKTKMQILQEAFDFAEGNTTASLFDNSQQGANLVHNRQINSYDEEIQQSKSAPDYSESSNTGDLRLYPTPQNREAYNSWDTIGLNGNQQEHISTAQNNADISALQQQYGNEQLTEKTQGNSPNLNDNQGHGNLGSYIGNRSQVTNQRGQLQNSSAQGNQDNISTANNLNNQRAQGQITAEQDNSQDNSFAVPQYADISGLIQSEQNNNEDTHTAEALNRTQNDNQQKLSPFDEALRGALQVINDEFDKNPHDKYSVESLWAYMGSLPQDLNNQVAEYIHKQGLTKAYVINDWQTNPETQRLPSYVVPDPKRLKQLLQQLNNSANQQDSNQQQLPKPQDNSAQNFDYINNQQERSKTDDYLPPETIRTKEGDITARGARVQRSFIPSEQEQIKNAARTGKSATRYIFARHGERDTSAPSNNNPEKYSYDAKLTGYNGYLGDIQIAAGDNSVPLHAFFGTQDGRHYVGITDQNGNFFATYDLQNNQFFINEGSEDNPLVKNYSALRLEKDFRLAFTYDNDSDMDIDFSKNPTEEILRRLVMMKAINAGEVDTVADADSQIYMAMNKYFASQSGVSLLDMVMADNLIINKVNKQGDNGDRGSTKIIPEMGIDGNPIFEAQTILSLFKKSDVSTVPHEFWHIYEEKIKRLANAGLIKKGSKLFDDWQTIRSEAGMLGVDFSQKLSPQDNAKWRNSQEKNAAMFEQYLRQGKAPQGISAKLRQVFNNFKNWLGNLYRKARDIFYTNANGRRISQPYVSEPMRKVFDHIFTGGKNFNLNQSNEQGQKLSSYSDPQGFQEFRQSGLDPQGWFSRWFGKAKNWAGNLFHSVARVGLPKHATDWRSLPFPTQEIQGRFMEAMKTPPRLGMIGRMRQAVRDIAQSVKGGDYSDITLSPRKNDPNLHLNEALQAFRNLGRAKVAAADKAVSVMTDIISPLNQKQRELLNTYTVIRDVIDQIEEMPNSPLSFGLSQQDARKMNAELARMVDRDEQVRDAVKQLDDTRNAQVEEFKKHAHALGLNMDDLFHYPNYFRRRVIQYLDAARSGKRTPSAQGNLDIQNRYDGEINAIMGHSFFKKRKGTLQDYVTDYVQANAEVRAQLAQDIETMKTLEYITKNHDIAPRLRKQYGIKSQQLEIDYDGSQTFSQSGDEEQKTIHDVIPEGYEAFDPTATRLIETAQSAPENLMHMVANDIAEQHGFPVDELLERLGIQNDNNLMVIPTEIANTLRKMAKSRHRGMLGQAAKDFTTWWKRSVLFTPTRNLLYNIRNFTGDLDALIAGNPKALRHFGRAVRELTGWYTHHGKEGYEASQDLQDYIRLSGNLGIQSLNLSAKDAQAIVSFLDGMETEKDTGKIKSIWNKGLKPIRALFNAEHSFTEWREHLLRFAAYLDYKQQMETNKDGRPNNWGASIEEEVMSISDIKERAFKMSNELLGAYDQVSEVGKQLRDMLIPFYSWMEVNMRRTYRLLKNGFKYGYGAQQVKNLGVGKLAAMPLYALSAGQSVAKLMALTIAMQMFNRFVFPDADDDLPNDVKYRPHITAGEINGRVYYFDRPGAFQDAVDWFGLDSAWLDAKDFANGQKSIGSWLKQIVQAPFSKVINGLNPAIKMPIELAMGRSMFPNAFNPSTIRDPAEYVARSFGLAWPYKAARGIPHSNAQEASKMFIYSQDTDEAAYWQTLDRVRQFQNEVLDKHFDGFASTRRGRILANIKKALRYNDRKALRRFLREYSQADGSKQGLKQSMNAMNPLHGLNEKEKAQFLKWISADDRKYLRKAERYFHQLADRFIR